MRLSALAPEEIPPASQPMSPADFYDACEAFDWFYEMSDDSQVWRRGEVVRRALMSHAPEGSENRAIWRAWVDYHYSGEPWSTEKKPAPMRPVGVAA